MGLRSAQLQVESVTLSDPPRSKQGVSMKLALIILQLIISVLLGTVILLQQRGSGLSATFGGQGGFYTSKRGAEKVLHNATIVLGALFLLNSLAFLFV